MRKRYESQETEREPLNGFENDFDKHKSSIHSIPTSGAIIFILSLFALFAAVCFIDTVLPTPLKLSDEATKPNAFITERAQHDLKLLTSLGPRVTGSYENEVLAVNFFMREIAFIQQQTHRNQKIEVDFQTVSGAFFMDFQPSGAIHTYSKVQNIVVKLHGVNEKYSLLVNSHFDTVATSPGGSDDGINCAVMLEILRKLSRSPQRLLHNVIFLFNGAEEPGLKAAHGFVTQHKWAKEVRALINLEAGGTGGKEHLFQSAHNLPWLLNYYKRVPHPAAQVIAEEIFQNGFIPSDTDYRIFRDFGNITGLDFALIDNGYRYHTKYDDYENIPPGTYQHIGDNVLVLVRLIANASELLNFEQSARKSVFYDFLGFFLISYTENHAMLINFAIALLSIVVAIQSLFDFGIGCTRQSILYVLYSCASVIGGWIISGVLIAITAFVLDLLKSTLSWYGNTSILLGLYVLPTVACCCCSTLLWNNFNRQMNLSVSVQSQLQMHAARLTWTIVILIGTLMGIRSVYLVVVPVMFQTLTFILLRTLKLQHSVRQWQMIYVLGLIAPSMLTMQVLKGAARTLIPICGRIGPDKNPELLMGVYVCLSTILISSFYVPLITLVRKPSIVMKSLFGAFAIFVIIAITPLGFPYNNNPESPAPQRYWIYHTSRTIRNDTNHITKKNSGFFVMNWDRNAPKSIEKYVKDLSRVKSIADDCDTSLFCGLPLATSRVIGIIRGSTWVPAGQPIIHEPTSLKLISKTDISSTRIQYDFSAIGPSHLHLAISARANTTLIGTNLIARLPKNPIIWNGRPTYVILHTWGVESTPLLFSLEFEKPPHWSGPIFDIAISGKCMHDRTNLKTPQFVQFLKDFPKWTDVVPYLATYDSWVY